MHFGFVCFNQMPSLQSFAYQISPNGAVAQCGRSQKHESCSPENQGQVGRHTVNQS